MKLFPVLDSPLRSNSHCWCLVTKCFQTFLSWSSEKGSPHPRAGKIQKGGPESHTSVAVRFGFAMEVTETLSTFHITRSHFPTLPQVTAMREVISKRGKRGHETTCIISPSLWIPAVTKPLGPSLPPGFAVVGETVRRQQEISHVVTRDTDHRGRGRDSLDGPM
ncbi:unnamed protein product [Rangifer tarandus platyrhynchus]|uniref:Uncharacterized protein n=1 Tax=Rangifer tarandus platyrhynchus TaxID=3082113 RepID=A0ACB1KHP1_RANTA